MTLGRRSLRQLQDGNARHDEGFFDRTTNDEVFVDEECQVSNDPPPDGGVPILTICDVTSFECLDADIIDVPVIVPYLYEVHYNPDADLGDILPYLEESMLEHCATAMGLTDCSATYRRRSLQEFSEEQRRRFVGVYLDPPDAVDRRFDSCLSTVSEEIAEKSECVPMQGGMTVSVMVPEDEFLEYSDLSPEQKAAAKTAVTDFLRTAMNNDVYVVPNSIEKVVFIDERSAIVPNPNTEEEVVAVRGGSSLRSSGKAIIAVAAGIALLLILIFAMLRRRRNEEEDNDRGIYPVTGPIDDDLDEAKDSASLAHKDSLALKPQGFIGDADDLTVYTVATGIVTLSPSKSPAVAVDGPCNHAGEMKEDGASVDRSESRSQSHKFAEYDTVVMQEAIVHDDLYEWKRSVSPSEQRITATASGEEGLAASSFQSDDGTSLSGSEFTPRRALQMS